MPLFWRSRRLLPDGIYELLGFDLDQLAEQPDSGATKSVRARPDG